MRNERGATMVEASIVASILVLALLLICDCALLMRANLSARYGATSGARAGAVAGTNPSADFDILRQVAQGASAQSNHSLVKVVVYNATSATSSVPDQCLENAVAGLCNVYGDADLERPESDFGSPAWTGDDYWKPSERLASRSAGLSFVGVYVETKNMSVTKLFPTTAHYSSVTQVEATQY